MKRSETAAHAAASLLFIHADNEAAYALKSAKKALTAAEAISYFFHASTAPVSSRGARGM